MDGTIDILLCEDRDILLDGLKASLGREKDIRVLKAITDSEDILETLQQGEYDLLLTDIVTANKHNALEYIPAIKEAFPEVKIITITGFPDISFMEKARKAGVNSFVYKNVPFKELLNLIRNTTQGYSIYPSAEHHGGGLLGELTPAEMRVLRLFCAGNDRTEIAKILNISVSSVKNHISSILGKTGYPNLVKLGMYVVKEGLILPE